MKKSIRLIPCLDIDQGVVKKGVNFEELRNVGDPVELAAFYGAEGADELIFLDITATHEGRPSVIELAERVADTIFIPFTVGGGLKTMEEVRGALMAGADKVSINSAALKEPEFITKIAEHYGNQALVLAIDAKRKGDGWEVYSHGGRKPTGKDAVQWAQEGARLGAGEILLTSMDGDGTRKGYDLELTAAISEAIPIPVIASGGAGNAQDLIDGIRLGKADAVLLAGILHDGVYRISELKEQMAEAGLPMRMPRTLGRN